MNIKDKKTKKKELNRKNKESSEFFYLSDNAQNIEFSDYVRLNSYPRGIVLSFGKWIPDKKKFGVFKEILLPFDVADSLKYIIEGHIKELVDKKLIILKPTRNDEVKKK